MKNVIIIIAVMFTVLNTAGQVLPRNVRKAEKNYSIVAQRAIARAKRTIELSKQKLIEELKKEAKKAIKNGDLKSVDAILDRIKEVKARNKVEDFFGSGSPRKQNNNVSVVIEDDCPKLNNNAEPWTNKGYKFLNVPKKLMGKKYFQYKAKSKKGVTLIIYKNCLVRVIVGGSKGDLPAVAKWEQEGWKRDRNYNLRYSDRLKSKLIVLSRLSRAGTKIRMNDYSAFAGIIVLAN